MRISRDNPSRNGLGDEQLREALDAHGFRLTPQRRAVYAYLSCVHDHPTAESVFVAVRKIDSRISLATVYNTLESLVEAELASKYEYGDRSARYDIRTDEHSHLRCVSCNRISDLELRLPPKAWRSAPVGGFKVSRYRLELLGLCRRCNRAGRRI
jgi:Fur family peroxide stress response transcriptional regulator